MVAGTDKQSSQKQMNWLLVNLLTKKGHLTADISSLMYKWMEPFAVLASKYCIGQTVKKVFKNTYAQLADPGVQVDPEDAVASCKIKKHIQ